MQLFDTHTHLNVDHFHGQEELYLNRAFEEGVHYLAVVGFDWDTIEKSLSLSNQYDHIISVVGCHPTEASQYDQTFETALHKWLELDRVKMLGEIGLDYYWDRSPRSKQIEVFRRQIAIAKEHNLPITIHNREATEDCYQVLKEEGLPQAGGIMHSFGSGPEVARRFLDLGMHLSFSGVLTFKKSDEVRQAAALTPLDRLLIETDAPYLAPVPMRGKPNEPAYVKYVAECLAQVKDLTVEEVARLTSRNAFELFQWYPQEVNYAK